MLWNSTLPAPRLYRDESDLNRMADLLRAGRAAWQSAWQTANQFAGLLSYYVHPGDLKWWLYYPPLGATWWEHIYLWEAPGGSGSLLGWALIEPRGETFDVFYRPELHGSETAAAMFAWAEDAAVAASNGATSCGSVAAGKKETGMFWVIPEDTFRIRWLEERGYGVLYQSVALARSLVEPVFAESQLPGGFTIRPCQGVEEVEARARAQHGAFRSTAPFDQYIQRFTSFMQSPGYTSGTDLVAASPDGRIAAFCITWNDEPSRVALFEPVGTHPDFQRKGLGKALLLAALRRLRAQGMQQAIVSTGADNVPAISLYQSVGFQQYSTFRFYGKAVNVL